MGRLKHGQLLAEANCPEGIHQAIRLLRLVLLFINAHFLALDSCEAVENHKRWRIIRQEEERCHWQNVPFAYLHHG